MNNQSSVSFSHYRFDDLSIVDLYGILKIRSLVFNHQQRLIDISDGKCVEIDGKDVFCTHIVGKLQDNQIVATARLFDHQSPLKLGRFAVDPDFQKHGFGSQLLDYLDSIIYSKPIEMDAQSYLIDWYSKFQRPGGETMMPSMISPHFHTHLMNIYPATSAQ